MTLGSRELGATTGTTSEFIALKLAFVNGTFNTMVLSDTTPVYKCEVTFDPSLYNTHVLVPSLGCLQPLALTTVVPASVVLITCIGATAIFFIYCYLQELLLLPMCLFFCYLLPFLKLHF